MIDYVPLALCVGTYMIYFSNYVPLITAIGTYVLLVKSVRFITGFIINGLCKMYYPVSVILL